MAISGDEKFLSEGLLGDPIHKFISLTVPAENTREVTEKDLIDSRWVQRLRRIHQLQSAWWVYPAGEHTRFQHSVGVMHLAGRFMTSLYPSLKNVCLDAPSIHFCVELARLSGLLHDVGHGPFGHFLDNEYWEHRFHINHEDIGQQIILKELPDMIRAVRRSPDGAFFPDESLQPEFLTFLIKKPSGTRETEYPRWLHFMRPLLSGVYTADNMDFVVRDSYMCGIDLGPVAPERLIYYSFFSDRGLTLHKRGISSLKMFLLAKQYLFENIYYHRTTRLIDLQMKEVFSETMEILFPNDPLNHLEAFYRLTDWSLLTQVADWEESSDLKKQNLGKLWKRILERKLDWREIYDQSIQYMSGGIFHRPPRAEEIEDQIRAELPSHLRNLEFAVDMAPFDPRPDNPFAGPQQINIYDPEEEPVDQRYYRELFDTFPVKIVKFRIFIKHSALAHKRLLREATKKVAGRMEASSSTNI
ncbi:MAG TPA: HD domain-containing protein [bacterium]|nr:HD domain-containing protein [bacterium]